ncbi:MAG: tripartite tricarboxylate transporter TctB family protein [Pseudomonadota bacterium]
MKTPSGLRPGELIFALMLLAFSLVALREAYAISGFSGLTTGGVLPMLASGIMVVSGLAILRDVLRRCLLGGEVSLSTIGAFLLPMRLLLFGALLLLYALAIPRIGFIAASGGFLFLSILYLWRRGFVWSAGISLVAILAVYVLFRLVFQVVLPMGSVWS